MEEYLTRQNVACKTIIRKESSKDSEQGKNLIQYQSRTRLAMGNRKISHCILYLCCIRGSSTAPGTRGGPNIPQHQKRAVNALKSSESFLLKCIQCSSVQSINYSIFKNLKKLICLFISYLYILGSLQEGNTQIIIFFT